MNNTLFILQNEVRYLIKCRKDKSKRALLKSDIWLIRVLTHRYIQKN